MSSTPPPDEPPATSPERPELGNKRLPPGSRQVSHSDPYARYRARRGEMSPPTVELAVPVQVVIDHEALVPLDGSTPPCNQQGNPHHNARVPIFFWFQETPVGPEIYVVFYTSPCAWRRCSFCTLPSESSPTEVTPEQVYLQALLVFDSLSAAQLDSCKRLFLSNNGSILDSATVGPELLWRICDLAHKHCPNLSIVCLETRIEYATDERILECLGWLDQLHEAHAGAPDGRICPESARLQLSIGYETQDPYLRNAVLWKGYEEEVVQRTMARWAAIQERTGKAILLDDYIMLKPAVGMTDEQAVAEAAQSLLHLQELARHHHLEMSVRLNPTFAAVGSELHYQFQRDRYRPPTYRHVVAVLRAAHQRGLSLPVFLGLNNEGLSYREGSFGNRDESDHLYLRALQDYNSHQGFARLEADVAMIEDCLSTPAAASAMSLLQEARRLIAHLGSLGIVQLRPILDQLGDPQAGSALGALVEQLSEATATLARGSPAGSPRKVSRS